MSHCAHLSITWGCAHWMRSRSIDSTNKDIVITWQDKRQIMMRWACNPSVLCVLRKFSLSLFLLVKWARFLWFSLNYETLNRLTLLFNFTFLEWREIAKFQLIKFLEWETKKSKVKNFLSSLRLVGRFASFLLLC